MPSNLQGLKTLNFVLAVALKVIFNFVLIDLKPEIRLAP